MNFLANVSKTCHEWQRKVVSWWKKGNSQRFVFITILAFLVALEFFLATQAILSSKRNGSLIFDHPYMEHGRGGEQKNDKHPVINVESWMTFRYLNINYNLPPDYLRDSLSINDPEYPDIRLDRFSRKEDLSESIFILAVKGSIREFFDL